jgi:MYXO-CTERM domain-containing protein
MKKTLSILTLAAGTALALATVTPATAAVTVTFVPSATNVAIGDVVVIKVNVSGLDAEVVSAFDLNFLYNASVFDSSGSVYRTLPLGNQTPLNTVLAPGDLGFDVVSLDDDATLAAAQPNSFELFEFSLTGKANGVSNFTLGSDPDFQRAFIGLSSSLLAVDVGSVCLSVGTGTCTVPEPGTYGLAGVALFGALLPGFLRRRRKG